MTFLRKRRAAAKNRPNDHDFYQQNLKACGPEFSFRFVFWLTFVCGIVFAPLGFLMLWAASSVQTQQLSINDGCPKSNETCIIDFKLDRDFIGPVFFHYELENFYHNVRRFAESESRPQLMGFLNITDGCGDYAKKEYSNITMGKCKAFGGYKGIMHNCPWPWDWLGSLQKILPFKVTFFGKVCEHKPVCKKYYAPCGAMANSMYNDTFELSNSTGKINWTFDGLLLPEERLLYAHPKRLPNETLCDAYNKRTVRPKSWTKDVCELDPNNENNTGFKNFDFIVWMRSTINSRVRKIYRRFDGDLKSGNYTLKVRNNFRSFNGTRWFLITTTTWFGGDSKALGSMYLFTGFGCILLATGSLIAHRYKKNVLK
ncbi:Protein of unknown function DUF284,transmembrane eukaryotic family-containing protein [Aphelenchoides besseyi]|nr:Protein of unknown function DUF284,transmembrane eukaryotic family-containing protein [Aphelenchoides besseyi]